MPSLTSTNVPRAAMLLGVLLFGGFGLLSLLNAMGFLSAGWLHPNRDVPRWVFLLVGAIMPAGA
jgi:hypothetical protein